MSSPVIVVFSLLLFCYILNVVFSTESCLHESIRRRSEKSDLVLRVNATSSEFGKNASTVFDGSQQTCFSTRSTLQGVKKHEIEIQLNRKVEIIKIIVHVEPNISYNFTVLVENHLGPTLCYNISSGKTGVIEFSCVNVNLNASVLKYDKIRIADNFQSGKFTVCEVDIVVNKKMHICIRINVALRIEMY
ncbi:hypothetical protein B4U80_14527 [Leptotrombidium deliense]|uniref:Uncharacterized protein n=1 Tax=Leptotrombidium deliense TaxID=299467 RepID=A0A443RUN1_9ACAR|nr:hypothetical protein B4U80_14527 [Leptotrombidium deliense]